MFAPRSYLLATTIVLLSTPEWCPAADDKADPNVLSLQVTALEMLHRFQATPEQLDAILKVARATPPKEGTRKPAKVSIKFLKTLTEVRDAYVNNDEDAIADKSSELDELRDKDAPDLDDDVELTDAVRKAAPAGLKAFTPRQLALYLADFAEEFPDPFEKITETFDDARTLKGKDWDDSRDLVSDQLGWLVGGLDAAAEARVKKQVANLLDRVHLLNDADYKAKKDDLSKEAKDITAAVGPLDVMRNFMERSIAELLSNPQTVSALEARLKKAK